MNTCILGCLHVLELIKLAEHNFISAIIKRVHNKKVDSDGQTSFCSVKVQLCIKSTRGNLHFSNLSLDDEV